MHAILDTITHTKHNIGTLHFNIIIITTNMSKQSTASNNDNNNIQLMTDDEFYEMLDHCMQCFTPCNRDELQSYLGVCHVCHIADLFEIAEPDDDDQDDDQDDDMIFIRVVIAEGA